MMNAAMKIVLLSFVIILFAACGAPKPKPAAVLTPANVRLDPICEVRAILKYDRGEGIEADGNKKADAAIDQFCGKRKHKILVEGERKSGEKKFTKIIVFECTE